jgi:hypothetical protein
MSSLSGDPRTKLISAIDLASCRVEFSDKPLVLLCGGPAKIKERPDDPDPPVASLRDAITRANTSYEVFRPEEITSWHADGVYKNLVSFEADLASVCSLIVIVLESVGSLAELGAFSQLEELHKKLIVILPSEFQDDPSFVNLGLLRYIAESNDSSVKAYPWDIKSPTSLSDELVDDVISDIDQELRKLRKSEVLKLSETSHVMVLICNLIDLFAALKESELLAYLDQLGVSILKDNLRRKLFLLEEFKLVRRERYSDSVFYMRGKEPHHGLRLGVAEHEKGAGYQDSLRIQVECIEYYNKNIAHKHRVRALAQAGRAST